MILWLNPDSLSTNAAGNGVTAVWVVMVTMPWSEEMVEWMSRFCFATTVYPAYSQRNWELFWWHQIISGKNWLPLRKWRIYVWGKTVWDLVCKRQPAFSLYLLPSGWFWAGSPELESSSAHPAISTHSWCRARFGKAAGRTGFHHRLPREAGSWLVPRSQSQWC